MIPVSATCRNKTNSNYLLKGERSEPKIVVFIRWKHEVLFNISVQYVIVLDYFVPTNSSIRIIVNKRSTFSLKITYVLLKKWTVSD